MSELKIGLREDRTRFRPGDELVGAAGWQVAAAPRSAEIRLFWFTRGKGTEDVQVIDVVRLENPQAEEARQFRFKLPASPYSFSGKLISLIWAIELVLKPSKESRRIEFSMSPDGGEIILGQPEQLPPK